MIDNVLESRQDFSLEQERQRFRFRTLNVMFLLAIFASLYYAIFYYFRDEYVDFYIFERNILFSLISALLFMWLRYFPTMYKRVLYTFIAVLYLLFIHILYIQVDDSSRQLWFIMPIVVGYYLSGSSLGIVTTLLSIMVLITYNMQSYYPSNISFFSLFDIIGIMVLLSILIAIFQKEYQRVVYILKNNEQKLRDLNGVLDEKIEEELAKSEEKTALIIKESRFAQMGKILSMIAHHWRQPLSSISTSSANMKMSIMLKDSSDEKYLHNIESIDYHVNRLSKTINDFRSFFQSSQQLTVTTAQKIMKDAFNIIQETMTDNGIIFDLNLTDNATVKVYKNEMVQAVLNILTNANEIFEEFPNRKSWMGIRSFHDEMYVYIEIEDNAGGIKLERLSDMFEPYFSTKKSKSGTGLGLYISKTIIESQAHGKLDVKQTEEGLCFTIAIPRFFPEKV